MVKMSKVRDGINLLKEILVAADQANSGDGRVHKDELATILKGEGYSRGSMFEGTNKLHAYARRIAGGIAAPTVATTNKAGDKILRAVEKAAAAGGNPAVLSQDEFSTLSPTAKAAVRFAKQYGGKTIDELFF